MNRTGKNSFDLKSTSEKKSRESEESVEYEHEHESVYDNVSSVGNLLELENDPDIIF